MFFNIAKWICEEQMTDEEKANNKSFYTTGGYLKKFKYKEAFVNSFNNADNTDRMKMWNCPNFDAQIFFEISGIDWYLNDDNKPKGK